MSADRIFAKLAGRIGNDPPHRHFRLWLDMRTLEREIAHIHHQLCADRGYVRATPTAQVFSVSSKAESYDGPDIILKNLLYALEETMASARDVR